MIIILDVGMILLADKGMRELGEVVPILPNQFEVDKKQTDAKMALLTSDHLEAFSLRSQQKATVSVLGCTTNPGNKGAITTLITSKES